MPIFTYSADLRARAADLLSPSASADRVWAYDARAAVASGLQRFYDKAAGGSFGALSVEGSERDAQRWMLENSDVLGAVTSLAL